MQNNNDDSNNEIVITLQNTVNFNSVLQKVRFSVSLNWLFYFLSFSFFNALIVTLLLDSDGELNNTAFILMGSIYNSTMKWWWYLEEPDLENK